MFGVSINIIIDDNGVIKQSIKAKIRADITSIEEEITIELSVYLPEHIEDPTPVQDFFDIHYSSKALPINSNLYIVSVKDYVFYIDLEKKSVNIADIWDGSIADDFEGGDGTAENPYIIYNAEQLAYFSNCVNNGENFEGKYIKLGNNIIINQYVSEELVEKNGKSLNTINPIGTPTNPFKGMFEGNDFIIYGFYCNKEKNSNIGLFGYINSGKLNNIKMYGTYMKGKSNVGSIVGALYDSDAIAGGSNYITITNCISEGLIFGNTSVGGIMGSCSFWNRTTISKCRNHCNITASGGTIGGIVGYAGGRGTFSYCSNEGNVLSKSSSVGAICGHTYNWPQFRYCYNKGSIKGVSNVRGDYRVSAGWCI